VGKLQVSASNDACMGSGWADINNRGKIAVEPLRSKRRPYPVEASVAPLLSEASAASKSSSISPISCNADERLGACGVFGAVGQRKSTQSQCVNGPYPSIAPRDAASSSWTGTVDNIVHDRTTRRRGCPEIA
jgi:hypothetical protein